MELLVAPPGRDVHGFWHRNRGDGHIAPIEGLEGAHSR